MVSCAWRDIVRATDALQSLLTAVMIELYFLTRDVATNHEFIIQTSHLLRSVSILDEVAGVENLILVNVLS